MKNIPLELQEKLNHRAFSRAEEQQKFQQLNRMHEKLKSMAKREDEEFSHTYAKYELVRDSFASEKQSLARTLASLREESKILRENSQGIENELKLLDNYQQEFLGTEEEAKKQREIRLEAESQNFWLVFNQNKFSANQEYQSKALKYQISLE